MDFKEQLLKIQMKSLKSLLWPSLNEQTPKCTVVEIYLNRLSVIETKELELCKSMKDYLSLTNKDIQLCNQVNAVIDEATNYASQVRNIYIKNDYHMKSQSSKLYETLPKFSDKSDIHIFEFIRRFESITAEFDIPAEKAEFLYSKFLCPTIQQEIIRYKWNYNEMKQVLIKRYGNVRTIVNRMLYSVSTCQIPSPRETMNIHLDYYRKLQFVFQNVNDLLSFVNVPSDEIQGYLFSNDFISKALLTFPQDAELSFFKNLQDLGRDMLRIEGKAAFKVLLSTINQLYDMYDSSFLNKPEAISVNVREDLNSNVRLNESNDAFNQNNCLMGTNARKKANIIKTDRSKSLKPISPHRFPCIIDGHNHSIGKCEEFFQISPQQRAEYKKLFRYKYCILCLQSSEICKFRGCANTEQIPSILQCKDCKAVSKIDDKQTYSIMFCFSERHSKPSNCDIIKALELYVPEFESKHIDFSINIAYQLKKPKSIKMLSNSRTRAMDPDEPISVYNTKSGVQELNSDEDIIKEPSGNSIQIMQLLNIKGKTVLTMFDTGANQNLVDGKLAEELSIKVIKPEPSLISVISGSKIWTEYGKYNLALGPIKEKDYFEMNLQGISSVTKSVPHYSLAQVNEVVRDSFKIDDYTTLPSYIGGDKVRLLIGLKNALIQPILLFTLSSGLGVYKSPFTDIFGSNICYGGPHSSFSLQDKTKMNKKLGDT